MSEQSQEPTTGSSAPDAKPEPLKFDTPVFDYIEKGSDPSGTETRAAQPGEQK